MLPFALQHVDLVRADGTRSVIRDANLVVNSQGIIESAGAGATIPEGYRIIDGTGRFVLPGLINAHAHLFADGRRMPSYLTSETAEAALLAVLHSPVGKLILDRRTRTNVQTQLHSGVTTIRSLGDVRYEVVRARDAISAGKYPGPRLIPAGPLLAVSGGHGAPQIALVSDNPWDARKNVRLNLRKGTSAIKIAATGGVTDARAIGEAGRPQMTVEEMRAICEEAHNAGVLVAAHAQSAEGITRALRAGVDTIEHGASMTPEMIELFLDNPNSLHGTSALVPTITACLPLVTLDPSVTGINRIGRANAELVWEEMLSGISSAVENEISLGFGTDSALTYVTHYGAWREMDYAVRYAGLTPAQVLHSATGTNARILGLEQTTGALEPGLEADFVVVRENPLENLRTLEHPVMVSARGQLIENPSVKRFPEVDQILDSL